MTLLHPVHADQYRQQPWANGQGRTTELAAGPDPDHWQWRISMARIDHDGPFSVLPGVRRQLVPLDVGLTLRFEDGTEHTARRLQVLVFDGGHRVQGLLPDGPGRDLNLMLREGIDGELMARPLTGTMRLPNRDGHWFILQLAGSAKVHADTEQATLESGNATWVRPGAERILIEGHGEIALVHLDLD